VTEKGKRVYSLDVYCDASSHPKKRVKIITFLGTYEVTFTGYTERIVWRQQEPVSRRTRHENNKFKSRAGAAGSEPIPRGKTYSHAWLEHMQAAGLRVTEDGVDDASVREHKVAVYIDQGGDLKPRFEPGVSTPTFKMRCELCGLDLQASQETISPLLNGLTRAGKAEMNLLTVQAWLARSSRG